MKHARLATFIVTATIGLSLLAATAASASAPEFNPGTPQAFTGDGSTSQLETSAGTKIECLKSLSKGEITGAKTVGNLVVVFHNCSSTEDGGCSLKSEGGPNASLIITKTLDGELGSVKKTEAVSGVGLLILPSPGTSFVTLEGTCLPVSPAPVTGSVAGEVTPVNGVASTDGKLIFQGNGAAGEQLIRSINVLGTIVKPGFKALGLQETNVIGVGLTLTTNACDCDMRGTT
jgi:hypothetical protein